MTLQPLPGCRPAAAGGSAPAPAGGRPPSAERPAAVASAGRRRAREPGCRLLGVLLAALPALAGACGGSGSAAAPDPCPDSAARVISTAAALPAPAPPPPPGSGDVQLGVQEVASGLDFPLYLTAPPGDPDRLFVVERGGRIRLIERGVLHAAPFLDIADRVRADGGEQGLLGLAFHPRYPDDPRLFVNYTDLRGDTRVSSFRVSPAGPGAADPASEALVLSVEQPFPNHNGGHLAFGPDGYLYIGLGDGGSGGDPLGHGQNPGTLLGAVLRIDVDRASPYAVPSTNPFVGVPGRCGEIWSYGLRNPRRFSFDRATGDLYIGDVGQNAREEIDVAPAASRGGENYGWNIMEGSICFGAATCNQRGLTLPVLDYDHSSPGTAGGCSVTGGYVYRGRQIPELQGHYLFADFCRGWVRSFRYASGRAVDVQDRLAGLGAVTSFGEDAGGELYILTAEGGVLRIVRR